MSDQSGGNNEINHLTGGNASFFQESLAINNELGEYLNLR
jgi:hypothetical protein